jgi:hypothetical protein
MNMWHGMLLCIQGIHIDNNSVKHTDNWHCVFHELKKFDITTQKKHPWFPKGGFGFA